MRSFSPESLTSAHLGGVLGRGVDVVDEYERDGVGELPHAAKTTTTTIKIPNTIRFFILNLLKNKQTARRLIAVLPALPMKKVEKPPKLHVIKPEIRPITSILEAIDVCQ